MFKLHIKLKNGEDREYCWDEVDFVVTSASNMFIVRDMSENLVFVASLDRIEYYERV